MKPKLLVIGILLMLFLSFVSYAKEGEIAGDASDILTIQNQYIKVFLNNSDSETGRFAVDVNEGDVNRTDDDNKPLIYGRPKPWTSFTTIKVDGKNYVFGKSGAKRAGAGLPQGEILEMPTIKDGILTMKCSYGAVTVEQRLDIVTSPTTGARDTARIKYIVRNTGIKATQVGVRTLFDTMVGGNDGAPFRIGKQEITYDFTMQPTDYPDYWQAFDSLENPSVIAQGTLKGGDVTPPDYFAITNWGNAADNPWELAIQRGRILTRLGEDELDSSLVMYWMPRNLQPNSEYTIVSYYGLGGVTFAPGNTFLGITAPAQVQYSGEKSQEYTVIAYMSHLGENDAKNVKINLDLPPGLELSSGSAETNIPLLAAKVTKQFSWKIKADGRYFGDTAFRLRVAGDGLESNEVVRFINIDLPLTMQAMMNVSKLSVVNNRWSPDPQNITVTVKNNDTRTAENLTLQFIPIEGVEPADGEDIKRETSLLLPGEQTTVSWQFHPLHGFKTGRFKVRISGINMVPLEIPGTIKIPQLPFVLELKMPEVLHVGDKISADLMAYNLYDALYFEIDAAYNRQQLQVVNVSRGTFLVENGKLSQWHSGTFNYDNGRLENLTGRRLQAFNGAETTLCRFDFVVKSDEGVGEFSFPRVRVLNSEGEELTYEIKIKKYKIGR